MKNLHKERKSCVVETTSPNYIKLFVYNFIPVQFEQKAPFFKIKLKGFGAIARWQLLRKSKMTCFCILAREQRQIFELKSQQNLPKCETAFN